MGKFKIGDKVRLREDVVVGNYYNKMLMSNFIYKELKNSYLKVKNFCGAGHVYNVLFVIPESGRGWYVGEDALELYQEDCPYKKGDILTIGDYKGSIREDSIGYYLELSPQSLLHNEACNKLIKLFGESVFIDYAHKCNVISCSGAFPDFNSIEDLVTFVNELNKLLDSKKESDLTTTKNYQNNEIKFQRAKASCKRGVVPAGSTISGRKDKIAISIGHLSYQVCNC